MKLNTYFYVVNIYFDVQLMRSISGTINATSKDVYSDITDKFSKELRNGEHLFINNISKLN